MHSIVSTPRDLSLLFYTFLLHHLILAVDVEALLLGLSIALCLPLRDSLLFIRQRPHIDRPRSPYQQAARRPLHLG